MSAERSAAALQDLFAIFGEPQSPYPKRSLTVVEEEIGLALPSDYRAWAGRYASPAFDDVLAIINRACVEGDVRREVSEALAAQRHSTRVLGVERVYDSSGEPISFEGWLDCFYPETPGLLGWGHAVGVGTSWRGTPKALLMHGRRSWLTKAGTRTSSPAVSPSWSCG